ncbi:transglutaminase domain-containing protein [Methanobrevibacter sp.]|uniref:transglutaminase domain-containing protein n=1 Tax=Methanobrevibacter sp. TaxID=66852 RepID=UPI0025DA57FF|nr:transglutaminase domain-containing protein [Methanobrevibacter sp.]
MIFNILEYFPVGVTINCKFALSLLLFIFILSVSAVSAEDMDDGNSFEVSETLDVDINDVLDADLDELDGDSSSNDDLDDNGNLDDDGDDADPDDETDNENEDPILKNTTLEIISPDDWEIYGCENYTVKLVDEDNNPVIGAVINFKIQTPKGTFINQTSITDDEGIAVLPLNLSLRGIYNISVSFDGDLDYYASESVNSSFILYEKTIIKTPKKYAYRSSNFTVKLVSSNGTPLSNKKLIIYIDGVKYTRTTDSKGQVYIKMPSDRKSVKFNCTFNGGDYYVKSFLSMKLPVYKKTYTKPLVYAVLKGKYFKVLLKGADGKILKKQKIKITIDGKNFTRTTNDKGIAYLTVNHSRNEYKVRFSYDNNGVYGPSSNSSILCVIDPSGQFKKGLNQNTKLSVSKYLYGGGYAKITKSIRKLSKKLTGKYSTKLEKATAIFNYVRDNLDYSYYANSKKGAAKTLKTKKGNCCDHSNLIVALCRASKIPARYSHAKGCKFGSGITTGHVWAQIYVNGRWYSADATSYRNSLGNIKNWNTKSYHKHRTYRNIPF